MSTVQNIKGEHLFLVLYKASKAVETYDNRSIGELGFSSISDFAVLEYLKTKGAQPVNTIGQSMMLTSGSMTTAVDRAQKNGYVTREHDPEDGRVVNVTLTEKGRTAIDNAFEIHASNLERLFNVFDKEEKAEFVRLMRKIGKTAEALNL
ncbi:MAG: MarR family transcriptional regulator [Opitutales bacterium]|jgi:MarR family transcriptional regulator, 2-MHQ and catechol-resistance regulon repressor|nr:MarR family transcriptional regulator [Opitutales bacterium]